MLPVRVKAVSSSSCTLPEASALLQRFLSSDACSDSFAGGYVVNVARALEELMPSKAESFEARAKERNHRHFPASHQNSDHSDEKKSLPVADNVGRNTELAMEAGSAMMQADKASKKHRKKRKHSLLDNGSDMVALEPMAGPSFDEQKRHDKKRSKKEEQVGEAVDVAHKASEKRFSAASLSVEVDTEYAKRRRRRKDKSVVENMDAHNTSEFKVSVAPLSVKVEEGVGSSKKRRKKEKTGFLATTDEVLLPDNNGEAADLQASPSDFPSLATEKKKKRKKKQGFDDSARQTLSY